MAEPVSITTTVITFATFIKDLIEVGQSIKRSIEKVGENRRRIRELTDDILRTLANLETLIQGSENEHPPALLGALGDLQKDMLRVHSICQKIDTVERPPGFRRLGSQVKLWIQRDDIEAEIRRLRKHVNKCLREFTTFSAARSEERGARIEQRTARIEDTSLDTASATLRVEHTLIVSRTENRAQLRRLEGMIAQVLLETPFGQSIANRTMDIISADPTHTSLESQYLSVQTMHLIESLQNLLQVVSCCALGPWNGSGASEQLHRNTARIHARSDG
ncbi:hypothetical protein B0H11DRAFT_1988862 [Mycena galericulata]|nr:hypothetical protein B0H11DRAFT_1988862 [Mycena galericulata]